MLAREQRGRLYFVTKGAKRGETKLCGLHRVLHESAYTRA